ncbi:Aldo/keto reductase [Stipitochalara longipes BDJ]|nr:Aldo/keto reductase [Stipitochalara longipes BDJ]
MVMLLIVGHYNAKPSSKLPLTAFTKWCPQENGVKSFGNAERVVNLALERLSQSQITLFQYHAWDYSDDAFLHNISHLRELQNRGKIAHIGLINTNTAHLKMLIDSGFNIATNQVSCSIIDRRITRQSEPVDINELNRSLRKYLRFIRAAGGWEAYQNVLQALELISKKHSVSISAIAMRYVLDIPSVKGVIVGTRFGRNSEAYMIENLKVFSFSLDEEDKAQIAKAQGALKDLPGDCGDKYRRPPFLTAAGDLRDHLTESDRNREVQCLSGSMWEPVAGYCRAVRVGNSIHISGTTANSPIETIVNIGGSSAGSQAVRILDIIEGALKALGSCMKDVVRTRVMIEDLKYCEQVARFHGWKFRCEGIMAANTLVTAHIMGDEMLVEIEAWAEAGSGQNGILRIEKW